MNNVLLLGEGRQDFDVPTILTTVETESFSGPMWPQLLDVFPEQKPIERTGMNSWDTPAFREAIKATGKKNILFSGLWTEVCITWPTLNMLAEGYNIYVVEDACAGTSPAAHDAALSRMMQAGAVRMTTVATVLEFQRDWANREHYNELMDLVPRAWRRVRRRRSNTPTRWSTRRPRARAEVRSSSEEDASHEPIHVAITRRSQARKWKQSLRRPFVNSPGESLHAAGVTGVHLVGPVPGSSSNEYGIMRSFESEAASQRVLLVAYVTWNGKSASRPWWRASGRPPSFHGLEAFFRDAGLQAAAALENGGRHVARRVSDRVALVVDDSRRSRRASSDRRHGRRQRLCRRDAGVGGHATFNETLRQMA